MRKYLGVPALLVIVLCVLATFVFVKVRSMIRDGSSAPSVRPTATRYLKVDIDALIMQSPDEYCALIERGAEIEILKVSDLWCRSAKSGDKDRYPSIVYSIVRDAQVRPYIEFRWGETSQPTFYLPVEAMVHLVSREDLKLGSWTHRYQAGRGVTIQTVGGNTLIE